MMTYIRQVVFLLVAGIYAVEATGACDCEHWPTLEHAFQNAESVFTARIVEVFPNDKPFDDRPKTIVVDVEDTFKGSVFPSDVQLPAAESRCGYLDTEHQMLVFSDAAGNTSRCLGTVAIRGWHSVSIYEAVVRHKLGEPYSLQTNWRFSYRPSNHSQGCSLYKAGQGALNSSVYFGVTRRLMVNTPLPRAEVGISLPGNSVAATEHPVLKVGTQVISLEVDDDTPRYLRAEGEHVLDLVNELVEHKTLSVGPLSGVGTPMWEIAMEDIHDPFWQMQDCLQYLEEEFGPAAIEQYLEERRRAVENKLPERGAR